MTTLEMADRLEAAVAAAEDGARGAATRWEHIRWAELLQILEDMRAQLR